MGDVDGADSRGFEFEDVCCADAYSRSAFEGIAGETKALEFVNVFEALRYQFWHV